MKPKPFKSGQIQNNLDFFMIKRCYDCANFVWGKGRSGFCHLKHKDVMCGDKFCDSFEDGGYTESVGVRQREELNDDYIIID